MLQNQQRIHRTAAVKSQLLHSLQFSSEKFVISSLCTVLILRRELTRESDLDTSQSAKQVLRKNSNDSTEDQELPPLCSGQLRLTTASLEMPVTVSLKVTFKTRNEGKIS